MTRCLMPVSMIAAVLAAGGCTPSKAERLNDRALEKLRTGYVAFVAKVGDDKWYVGELKADIRREVAEGKTVRPAVIEFHKQLNSHVFDMAKADEVFDGKVVAAAEIVAEVEKLDARVDIDHPAVLIAYKKTNWQADYDEFKKLRGKRGVPIVYWDVNAERRENEGSMQMQRS